MEPDRITARQIEAARRAIAHYTKRNGRMWIRIFPDKPFSKKPPEVTMGAGKGDIAYFVASVVPGKVMFEIDGLPVEEARAVLKSVSMKLSVRTKIVTKDL
jgi:large subunit ribosomal protein L16